MNSLHNAKFLQIVPSAAIVNNASFTTAEIDTKGYDYMTVIANIGATDVAMTALKLQASNTTGSGFADVTGLDMDGSTDVDDATASLPDASADDSLVVFQVNLKIHYKRFWDLVATAGNGSTGTYLSSIAILSRGEVAPLTAAEAGAATMLRI